MFLMSLYAIAVTLGLCLYWFLHNMSTKDSEGYLPISPSNENKDPAEECSGCTSGVKVQLKEVHHSNETASVQVMTPEGVTLVQANEKKIKRRPAPPPPPKQPPKRPPAPPPPLTQVIVEENQPPLPCSDIKPHSIPSEDSTKCSSGSDFPPSPSAVEKNKITSEDLSSPPVPRDIDVQPRSLDGASLIYPKNSYMSYRSERKLSRHGFDGKYQRSFLNSASSVDLASIDNNNQDGNTVANCWEPVINAEPHGTAVVFLSERPKENNCLMRSTSQDIILRKTSNSSHHISNINANDSKRSPTSMINARSNTLHRAVPVVPYCEPEQETMTSEVQNPSSPQSTQNKFELAAKSSEGSMKNESSCTESDLSPLDNNLSEKNPQNTIQELVVDHNQNSVHNNKIELQDFKSLNGNNDLTLNHCVNQVTIIPKVSCELIKTKEELNCEKLARDFIQHYGDIAVKNLFVPAPNHKTLSDYVEGLLNLELLQNDPEQNSTDTENSQCQWEQNSVSKKISSFEGKIKNIKVNDNQNCDVDATVKVKKDELIISIKKKLESLRRAQDKIRSEMLQNDRFGQEICDNLKELAEPTEFEKYVLHVSELEKIVNLLLSLSARLARAENILRTSDDCSFDEKKMLESKCNKLREQHEDACRLKENIDKRSNHVSIFLHKYFSNEDYAKYDLFIKMKTKFLVDLREIEEKINLGEEQLAALSVVTHLWKSANS